MGSAAGQLTAPDCLKHNLLINKGLQVTLTG